MKTATAHNKQDKQEDRWQDAQAKEDGFWKRQGVVDSEMQRVLSRYAPVIAEISGKLKPNAMILDVGCGPTCAGRLFSTGSKTFLDPLMDSYMQAHPEKLPEGEKICGTAENIPKKDKTFDAVICVNALDHMIDPGKALVEIRRVMKKDGIFILGMFLHPAPIAVSRMFIEKWLPFLREEAHPYSYTLKSTRKLLEAFFSVEREIMVFSKKTALLPALHREDWLFICRKK